MPIEIEPEAQKLLDEKPVEAESPDPELGESQRVLAMLREGKRTTGQRFVYNRLPFKFEKFFDGRPFEFDAHEEVSLPVEIAEFMYRNSVIPYEPVTGEAVRALVTTEDEQYGVPYLNAIGPELLSREVSDNYIQRGTGGVPTTAKVVAVKGGGYDNGRPASGRSRL